ncbi:transcriptional regulator, AraC family [Sphingobacterium spiritivorum ATCC 33300]|uniref:Transcriptional regulator, AraC family n=1 Tax=Sphingobacterium spiritivorum ATCC 33300 TaxID=525372 RepID=C2G2L8_SPHSI|nr:AraC family transcriptional regulator [Sphingobacterium spiritivorum]EEI90508.1 transcriptional regulator, AraC family [Sphingobacterium spiritivorum ATCC 33300]QQS95446.1 helix-turn-helix domain-containing protein [Sphingobacterium spiritivorum]
MKPQLLTLGTPSAASFSIRNDVKPQQHNNWHYHEELELIHIAKGSGTQFVGDSINNFENDNMVLLGTNLPHYWLFDEQYLQDNADIRVAHFRENFLGEVFFNLPENRKLKELFSKAKQGLLIYGATRDILRQLLEKLISATGASRIIILLEALNVLATSDEYERLTRSTYEFQNHLGDHDRLNAIIQYATQHYRNKISLAELAQIIGMTENSFCRFFKSKTGKTPIEFITELRIGHASRLLLEQEMPVKQICFESGFQNFVSFHKAFKKIKETTPLMYQKSLKK